MIIVSATWQPGREFIDLVLNDGTHQSVGCLVAGDASSIVDITTTAAIKAFIDAGGALTDFFPVPAGNDAVDELIRELETSHPLTHRSLREVILAFGVERGMLDVQLTNLLLLLRALVLFLKLPPGVVQVPIIRFDGTQKLVDLADPLLDLDRIPDFTQNQGMQIIKALNDQIVLLRKRRT